MTLGFARCGLIAALLTTVPSLSIAQHAKELTKEQRAALSEAMQKYGWSIPVCVWPTKKTSPPYCLNVADLTRRFPFHAGYISAKATAAMAGAYRTKDFSRMTPERILERLLESRIYVGCVPKGKNRGAVTLGGLGTESLPSVTPNSGLVKEFNMECEKDTERDPVMGLLAGSALNTPPLAPGSLQSLPTYQLHLTKCQEQQSKGRATGSNRPLAEGASTAETPEEKKKREEAEKIAAAQAAKEAAEKAQAAADAAAKAAEAAKQKSQAANQAATATVGDSSVSAADKDQAFRAAITAANDAVEAAAVAAAAQDKADAAADAYDVARGAVKDFYLTDVMTEAITLGLQDAGGLAVGTVVGMGADLFMGEVIGAGSVFGATIGVLNVGFNTSAAIAGVIWGATNNCADESCAASCDQKARAAALRDAIYAFRDKTCNFNVTPAPDGDDKCYDRLGGIFSPSQASVALAFEWACNKYMKDGRCEARWPHLFKNDIFDPCNSPVAMCSPEQHASVPGGGRPPNPPQGARVPSLLLPSAYVNPSMPGMWTRPRSDTAPLSAQPER